MGREGEIHESRRNFDERERERALRILWKEKTTEKELRTGVGRERFRARKEGETMTRERKEIR